MDKPGRDPENDLNEFERQLARLRPSTVAIDRDPMLFEAGRASAVAERRARFGPMMPSLFALVAVGLGGLLVHERAERRALEVMLASWTTEVRPVATLPTPPSPSRPIEPESYLALTRQFLAHGPDSSPASPERQSRQLPDRPTPNLEPLRVRSPAGLMDL